MLGAGIWFRFKPATDLLMGLAAACSLIALTKRASGEQARSVVLEWLEHPLLVAVGHFSYSLYLTHLPVLALCWLGLEPLISAPGPLTLALLGLGGLTSLTVGYAFFVAFERPFLSFRAARPAPSVA
jgi:peptidoglycan/LPS O-acetylase OafA/YrhL